MTENAKFWSGTSWKMNKTSASAQVFCDKLYEADGQNDPRIQRFVIPSFTLVGDVAETMAGSSVKIGVQNMHWEDQGAWTGEVSPLMVKDCGAEIVELGHSERREHFGETDETVGLKTAAAVRHGLTPLICIGETLVERDAGRAQEILDAQVRAALEPIAKMGTKGQVLLAYEPVWAIGENGVPADSSYADDRHQEIRTLAKGILGREIPCLYGGSVNSQNCEELINCPNIDGLFIGRSAWEAEGYLDILTRCARTL